MFIPTVEIKNVRFHPEDKYAYVNIDFTIPLGENPKRNCFRDIRLEYHNDKWYAPNFS